MTSEISSAAVTDLRGRKGFAEAMRADAEATVALFRSNTLLDMLMNDRARALFVMAVLYLHFGGRSGGRPGLTVGELKELCVELGLCSRGRCEALLAVLRAGGYVEPAPHDDRRRRPMVPTEKLVALQVGRWRAHLRAIAHVIPDAGRCVAALDRPDFIRDYALALGEVYVGGFRVLSHAPELTLFAERNAGIPILFALALEGGDEGTFPPARPVRLSINRLATQFAVSRKHVLTMLRDAEAAGLLVRGPDPDRVTLLAPVRDGLERFFAAIFLYLSVCAARAFESSRTVAPEPVG